jgi:hypothetical protein
MTIFQKPRAKTKNVTHVSNWVIKSTPRKTALKLENTIEKILKIPIRQQD